MKTKNSVSKELVGASMRPIVLALIIKFEKTYGWQIIQEIKKLSKGRIIWREGSLYPILHKMEEDGLIKSEWKIADNERPRKMYAGTNKSREKYKELLDEFKLINEILAMLA